MNLSVKLAMVSSLFFIGGMSFLVEQVARPLSAQAPLKTRSSEIAARGAPDWTAGQFVQATPVRLFDEVPREAQVVMASEPRVDLPPVAREAGEMPPVWSVSSTPRVALVAPDGFDAVVEAALAADASEAARVAGVMESAGEGPVATARIGPVSVSGEPRSYTVRQGDSLRKIARKHLNDESRWPEIQRLNKVSNADRIVVGAMLLLPPGDS